MKIEIQLKKASKKDFVVYAGQVQKVAANGDKYTGAKYKPKYGMPYWLFNSKGEIEKQNYIFTENTDTNEFNEYLLREQVLILNESII
jgi:hypothetical protein